MNKSNSTTFDTLFQKIQSYTETTLELFKLKMIEKTSEIFSKIASLIILLFFTAMFFIIINIGLSLLIGEWLGKSYYGFFIVAIFYLLLGIILVKFRKKLVKNPLISFFSNKYLNKSFTWDQ